MRVTLPFKTISCILILFSVPSPPARAQRPSDSAPSDRSVALLSRLAHAELGPDSRLYNGHEYIRNGTPAKGFPFFDSDSLQPSTLAYDGILYHDMPIEYDLVLDEVAIRDYTGRSLISLISEKIDHFSIGSHYFQYIAGNSAAGAPSPGFYEVLLSSGQVTLLARQQKKLVFPSNREDQPRYDQLDFYYLRLGDRFAPIDGKDALLDALKDKKEALKKYIKENKIRFKHRLETALILTTAHYMQLSH
jgi:hypothetical protein